MAEEMLNRKEMKKTGLPIGIAKTGLGQVYTPFTVFENMGQVRGPHPELSPKLLTKGLGLETETQRLRNYQDNVAGRFESPEGILANFNEAARNLVKRSIAKS